MQRLSIVKIPNQEFDFYSGSGTHTITLRTFHGITFASVKYNDETIVCGVRVVNNKWLVPYKYLTRGAGNFRFETNNSDYPHFSAFGDDVVLRYYNQEEYEKIVR